MDCTLMPNRLSNKIFCLVLFLLVLINPAHGTAEEPPRATGPMADQAVAVIQESPLLAQAGSLAASRPEKRKEPQKKPPLPVDGTAS